MKLLLMLAVSVSWAQGIEGFYNTTGDVMLQPQQSTYLALVQPQAAVRPLIVSSAKAWCENAPFRVEQGNLALTSPSRLPALPVKMRQSISTASGEIYKSSSAPSQAPLTFLDSDVQSRSSEYPAANGVELGTTPGIVFSLRVINKGVAATRCRILLYWTERSE